MGSLIIVGTGIMFPNQMTLEAAETMKNADIVFFNVGIHALAIDWIKNNTKKSFDLYSFYDDGKDRSESYHEMVSAMVDSVKAGKKTVGTFYGHPGVFVGPGFTALQKCRELNYPAQMLPGVSAVDCMFADLEFDPAFSGCLMVEASEYVLMKKKMDTHPPLVIWQAGVIGDATFAKKGTSDHVDILRRRLLEDYPEDQTIIAYIAATLPGMKPDVEVGTIKDIEKMNINASSTCLVPPINIAAVNKEVVALLRERLVIR